MATVESSSVEDVDFRKDTLVHEGPPRQHNRFLWAESLNSGKNWALI